MRKFLHALIIICFIGLITFIVVKFQSPEPETSTPTINSSSDKEMENPDQDIGTATGYFFFGHIDMREKWEEGEEEEEYYYHMDRFFNTYYEGLIRPFNDTDKAIETDVNYEDYFRELKLDVLSIPSRIKNESEEFIQNGDYISVEIEGPILESFPPQATIIKVEKISPRTIYR